MIVATDPSFSEQLKRLREAAGLTQYALAKKSGVTAQAISKLEKAENEPTWGTVRKLARALGISVADFDTGDENELPPPFAKKPAPKKPKPKG